MQNCCYNRKELNKMNILSNGREKQVLMNFDFCQKKEKWKRNPNEILYSKWVTNKLYQYYEFCYYYVILKNLFVYTCTYVYK